MGKNDNRYHIQAVKQAGEVLHCIAEARGPMGSGEVAKATGISTNTAFRLCITLADMNYLTQVGEKYDLGMGLALFWARKKSRLEGERTQVARDIKSLEREA